MADPQAALLTQLKNIQVKTGRTIPQLIGAVLASGIAKHGERRSWLMAQYKLGHGDANTVVHFMDRPLPDLGGATATAAAAPAPLPEGDPLDSIYSGAKAGLRPLHDAVMKLVRGFGAFEEAPKKSYISLRRKKQFVMLGPATKDSVEIGFNAKDLPPHARLKVLAPGGMCPVTTRIGSLKEVDAELKSWLKKAFDAAG